MTTFMEVGRLGELALQSTLWLALGLGLASCVRGPIRLRKRLLTGTLLGLVLLTALCLVPVPAWRLADLWPATATADSSTSRVQVFTGSAPAAAELDLLPWLLRLLRNSKEPATPTGRVDAVSAPAGGHDLVRLGPRLAVWGAGALTGFFLLRLLAGLWALRRFRAQSRPIGDVAMLTLMADLASALGVKRRPTLAEHPHLAAPATLGWRRPLILLPPSWRSWSDVERRCVLAHELAHVAAGDFALSWWAQFVRALYAWQPFAHSITRSLLDQMELLADQAAANAVGGMDAYARALCRLALRPTRPVPQPPALAFWPASLSLSWRMTMLKQGKCERVPGWPLRLTLASLLTLGLAITTGLRGPVAAQEPPSAPEPRYAGAAAGSTGSPGAPVQVVRRSEPYDLRFVQSDAVGVWACRPVVALALPSVEPYLPALRVELTQAMLKQALGREMPSLDLASVEQAVGSLHFQPKTKEQRGTVHASLEMVRLVPGASWRTIFAQDCPDLQSEETAGRLFARLPMIPALDLPAPAIGLVDDRTLVIGDERRVKLILEGKLEEFKPVWSAATWDRLQNCWVAVGVDMNKARELVDRAGDGVQREMLKPYAAVWEKADCLLAGVLPLEPVGLRIISAAKANEQLTIDATFIDALKRACQDVVQETIGVQESKDPTGGRVAGSGQFRLEDLAGFRQSGSAGPGTRLVTGQLEIDFRLPLNLAEIVGPRQSVAPLPNPDPLVAFQLLAAEVDDEAARALEPIFTPMKTPAGPHPVASLLEAKQEEFATEYQRLRTAGHIKLLTAPKALVKLGQPDFIVVGRESKDAVEVCLCVQPLQFKDSDLVEFELAGIFTGPGRDASGAPTKQESRQTVVGRFGSNYVTLLRKEDGKGWWLFAASPLRP